MDYTAFDICGHMCGNYFCFIPKVIITTCDCIWPWLCMKYRIFIITFMSRYPCYSDIWHLSYVTGSTLCARYIRIYSDKHIVSALLLSCPTNHRTSHGRNVGHVARYPPCSCAFHGIGVIWICTYFDLIRQHGKMHIFYRTGNILVRNEYIDRL